MNEVLDKEMDCLEKSNAFSDLLPKISKKTGLLTTTAALLISLSWCSEKPIDVEKKYLGKWIEPSHLIDRLKLYEESQKTQWFNLKEIGAEEYAKTLEEWDYLLYLLKEVPDLKHKIIIVECEPEDCVVLNQQFQEYWFDTSLRINPYFNTDEKDKKRDFIDYDRTFSTIKYMKNNNLLLEKYNTQYSNIITEETEDWKQEIKEDNTRPLFVFLDSNRLSNVPIEKLDLNVIFNNISPISSSDLPDSKVFKNTDNGFATRNWFVVVSENWKINIDLAELLKEPYDSWINTEQIKLPTNIDLKDKDFLKFQEKMQQKIAELEKENKENNDTTTTHNHSSWGNFWLYYYLMNSNTNSWYPSPSYTNKSYKIPNTTKPVKTNYSNIVQKFNPHEIKVIWAENYKAYKNPNSKLSKASLKSSARWG